MCGVLIPVRPAQRSDVPRWCAEEARYARLFALLQLHLYGLFKTNQASKHEQQQGSVSE